MKAGEGTQKAQKAHKGLALPYVPFVLFVFLPLVLAQSAQTVWTGVYTEAQADRGKAAYETNCSSCHIDGPFNSDVLLRDWSGTNLDGLFNLIKSSMPANAPGTLSDKSYVDIMAYILRVDSFPSGTSELEPDKLKSIRVEAKNGSDEVPNFALVQVVGCLAQSADNGWALTSASDPVRTREPASSKDDELKSAQAKTLGKQRFSLMSVYPAPDPYKGHKIEAKGFLIRDPKENRLNITSVQSLAPRCDLPK